MFALTRSCMEEQRFKHHTKGLLTVVLTVCTKHPIESVKSYGLNSYNVPYFMKTFYAETLSDNQWTGTTNRNRIWFENVLPIWMQ